MVKHVYVITGGSVDLSWLSSFSFQSDEENIVACADRGLYYADTAGLDVNYILGDFDSLPQGILEKYQEKNVIIDTFPPEKDFTDTHLALLWAIDQKPDKVTIIGGMGTRFDHSFANIGLLSLLLEKGIHGEIVDPYNCIFMMDKKHSGTINLKSDDMNQYISLIPYTEKVTGITLNGFKYPLNNETLTIGVSRGISNELVDSEGSITVEDGILIVSISRDEKKESWT